MDIVGKANRTEGKSSVGSLRVLVVGPFDESGGMSAMTRLSAAGHDAKRIDLARCDTAKDTRANRTIFEACWSHVRRWWRLVRLIGSHQPDVVHIHTCSFGTFMRTVLDVWTCRALSRRYVLHIHGGEFVDFLASVGGLRRLLVFGALKKASSVVVLSQVWLERLTQLVPELPVRVIQNAVESVDHSSASEERGGGVLFVGDLSEVKRPEDLLVAYSALPRAIRARFGLTFVGGGEPQRQTKLAGLARRLGVGDDVRFFGKKPPQVTRWLMGEADLLALPSRAEGMPIVLLEAMHAGLPFVASRVGAVPEMVEDGVEARLFEPRDVFELTSCLKEMLSDDGARRRMGSAARRRAERCNGVTGYRSQLAELWSEIVTEGAVMPAVPVPNLAGSGFKSASRKYLGQLCSGVRFW